MDIVSYTNRPERFHVVAVNNMHMHMSYFIQFSNGQLLGLLTSHRLMPLLSWKHLLSITDYKQRKYNTFVHGL
jgi:hypothetical protein